MTWNYRVITFEKHRALHEVYYDPDGRPTGYTKRPVGFVEDLDEINGIGHGLALALGSVINLPPLAVLEFDKPIDERPVCPRTVRFTPAGPAGW